MTHTKENPGAGGSAHGAKANSSADARLINQSSSTTQAGAPAARRAPPDALAVTDGAVGIGHIAQHPGGGFDAWDAFGNFIGTFPSQQAAVRSIPVQQEFDL